MTSTDIGLGLTPAPDDDIIRRVREAQAQRLRESVFSASLQDPEKASKALQVGLPVSAPPQSVDRSLKQAKAQAAYERVLSGNIAPSFFADADFAAIALDDADNFGVIEETWNKLIEAAQVGGYAVGKTTGAAVRQTGMAVGKAAEVAPFLMDQFVQSLQKERGFAEFGNYPPILQEVVASGNRKFAEDTKSWLVDSTGYWSDVGTSMTVSIEQMLFFAAISGGNPLAVILGMGAVAFGAGTQEAQEAGKSFGEASLYGTSAAAIEMGLGALPVGAAFGRLGAATSTPLRRLSVTAVSEGITESLTEMAQGYVEWKWLNPDKASEEFWKDIAYRVKVAAVAGAGAGFMLSGAVTAAQTVSQRIQSDVTAAKQNHAAITKTSEATQQSKTTTRAKARMSSFLDSVHESANVEEYRFDAAKFAELVEQAGGVEAVEAVLPEAIQQLREKGAEEGTEITLKPGLYHTTIGADPKMAGLFSEHIRAGESEYSYAEAREIEARSEELAAELAEDLKIARQEEKDAESEKEIEDEIVAAVLGPEPEAEVQARQQAVEELKRDLQQQAEPAPKAEEPAQPAEEPAAVVEENAQEIVAEPEAVPPETVLPAVPQETVDAAAQGALQAAEDLGIVVPEPVVEPAVEPAAPQPPVAPERIDFTKWFGRSEAVDRTGSPLVMTAAVVKGETGGALIYTEAPASETGVAVSVQNPMQVTGKQAQAFVSNPKVRDRLIAEAKTKGFDGLIVNAKTKDDNKRVQRQTLFVPLEQAQVRDFVTPPRTAEPDVLQAPSVPGRTPEQDAAYMEAVESGTTEDMEAAERQAAEKVSKHVYRGFHGLSEGYLEGYSFDTSRLGQNTGAKSAEMGIFVGAKRSTASGYANAFPPDTVFDAAAADTVQRKVSQLQRDLKQRMSLHGERVEKVVDPRSSDISKIESSGAIDGSYYDLPHTDSYAKVSSQIQTYGEDLPSFTITSSGQNARAMTEMALYDARDVDSSVSRYIDYILAEIELAKSANLTQRVDFLESELVSAKETSGLSREIVSSIETVIKKVDLFGAIPQDGILDVWVLMDNPLVYDYEGKRYREETYADVVQRAIELGHDGVVIKNTFDPGPDSRVSEKDDIYVVFSPEQIKSRGATRDPETGNVIPLSQRFNPEEPSILYAPGEGAPGKLPPGRPPSQVTREQIRAQAKLYSSMVGRLARDLGIPAKDLWNTYKAKIVSATIGVLTPEQQAALANETGVYVPKNLEVVLNTEQTASTLIHEMSHHYLYSMLELSRSGVLTGDSAARFGELLKFLGVDSVQAWDALPVAEKTKRHERFAYTFEKYLAEGQAPSLGLRDVFRKVAQWLKDFYGDVVAKLDSDYFTKYGEHLPALTGEVRALFDSLLATDSAISRARAVDMSTPLFMDRSEFTGTDEQWSELQDLYESRDAQAFEKLLARRIRDVNWSRSVLARVERRVSQRAANTRKRVAAEVRAELMQQPIYQAVHLFRRGEAMAEDGTMTKVDGPHRLDLDAARRILPDADFSSLSRGRYRALAKGGVDPNLISNEFGYSSGAELLQAMLDTPPIGEAVEARVEERMKAEYSELSTPEAIQRQAARELQSELHARIVATELKLVSGATTPTSVMTQAARTAAVSQTNSMLVRDVKESTFLREERRASQLARKAQVPQKGRREIDPATQKPVTVGGRRGVDDATVVRMKRRQLLYAQMARVARDIVKRVGRYRKRIQQVRRSSFRERVGADGGDVITQLLSYISIDGKTPAGVVLQTVANVDAASWLQKMSDDNWPINVDLAFMQSFKGRDIKDMTVAELDQFMQMLEQVIHVAELSHNEQSVSKDKSIRDAREELRAETVKNAGAKSYADDRTTSGWLDMTKVQFAQYGTAHITAAAKMRRMDGRAYGPWFNLIWDPAQRCADKKDQMKAEVTRKLNEILTPLRQLPAWTKLIPIPELGGRMMNMEGLFSVLLNLGNEGNINRLLKGDNWTYEQVVQAVSRLPSNVIAEAQQAWDLFAALKPEVARIERATKGREPVWVEPRMIRLTGSDGKTVLLRGGYYPIDYDSRANIRMSAQEEKQMMDVAARRAQRKANTTQTFTIERVEDAGEGKPLRLTLDVLTNGLDMVIHDIAWREWVIDTHRILNGGANPLLEYVRQHYGVEFANDLNKWVERIATDNFRLRSDLDRLANAMQRNVSVGVLAYNLYTLVKQTPGFLYNIPRNGLYNTVAALNEFLSNPAEAYRFVMDNSPQMALRHMTRFREAHEVLMDLRNDFPRLRKGVAGGYSLIQMAQSMPDTIVYLAGYQKALEDGMTEQEAHRAAYDNVIQTQSSGRLIDLSTMEAESGGVARTLLPFYRVMNTALNLYWAETHTDTEKSRIQKATEFMLIFGGVSYVGVVMDEFIRSAVIPGSEEEEDEAWSLKRQAMLLLSETFQGLTRSFGLIGQFSSVFDAFFGNKYYPYRGPMGMKAVAETERLANQLGGAMRGERDWGIPLAKAVVTFSAIGLPIPYVAINRGLDAVDAYLEGDDNANPFMFITGTQR